MGYCLSQINVVEPSSAKNLPNTCKQVDNPCTDIVKPLLSGHPQEWANWLLDRGWPLKRGFPKCSIKYGKNGTVSSIYSILSRFTTTVYHVVFDELLKETGHGSGIILSKYPPP